MTSDTRYREVDVSGPPRELGQQIGEALGEEIRGFCDVALERVNKTTGVTREQAVAVATDCLALADDYNPDLVEELRGTAEAAGVDLVDLVILQVRNQLTAEPESGCTSLSLAPGRAVARSSLVAQNWDNDPALDPFTIVLTRRPVGKPAQMTVTQAGLIAYIGCNDAGIGACLNTLPAPSRPRGVPHYFTLRDLYEQRSLPAAVESIRRARRAIPANIMLATPEGPADLEVTLDDVHVLQPNGERRLTHTNHCRHAELVPINDRFPELIQSHARQRRIDRLLDAAGEEPTLEVVKQALSDHQDHPHSICRHPNDDPDTGFWRTVFSVIIESDSGRMHVSRGNPCEQPYETYELSHSPVTRVNTAGSEQS